MTLARLRLPIVAGAVATTIVLTGCIAPAPLSTPAPLSGASLTADQQLAYDLVNSTRAHYGRAGLSVDWEARNKAQSWAQHLAAIGYLAHSNLADGITGTWYALAENVALADNGSIHTAHAVFTTSGPHLANIIDPKWTGVGTGVAYAGARVYVVQVFIQR